MPLTAKRPGHIYRQGSGEYFWVLNQENLYFLGTGLAVVLSFGGKGC